MRFFYLDSCLKGVFRSLVLHLYLLLIKFFSGVNSYSVEEFLLFFNNFLGMKFLKK